MLNGGYLWFTGEVKNQFIIYIGAVSATIFSTAILLALHVKRRCPLVISLSKPTDKRNVTEYLISILTSAWPNSQCSLSTSVSLKLQGVYDNTGFILLKNQKARREIFRRGANDIFHITTDKSLGDLVSVSLKLLNKFDDVCCKWVPVKIELMRFDTREKWNTKEIPSLICTKEVTKTIPVSKPMIQTLRFRNYARNVFKFHNWISLFMFPECYGAFTITDRIILLIFTETSFLFGCMVTFFLFHQNCTDFQLLLGDLIALFVTLFTMGGVIISVEVLMRNVRPSFQKKYSGLPKRPALTNKKEKFSSLDEYLNGLKNVDGSDAVDADRKMLKSKPKSGSKGHEIKNHKTKYSAQKSHREKKERSKQKNKHKKPVIDKVEFSRPEQNKISKEIKRISMDHSMNNQINNCNCNVIENQISVLNSYDARSKTEDIFLRQKEWGSEENCKSKMNLPMYIKSVWFEENPGDEYKTYKRLYKNDSNSLERGSFNRLTDQPRVINMEVIDTDFLPLGNTRQSKTKLISCHDMSFYGTDDDWETHSGQTTLLSKSSNSLLSSTTSLEKTHPSLNYNCSSKPGCYTLDGIYVPNEDDTLTVRQKVRNPDKSACPMVNYGQKERCRKYVEIRSKDRRTDTEIYDDQNDTLLPSAFLSLSSRKRRPVTRVAQEKQQYVKVGAISSQPSVNTSMTQNISKMRRKSDSKADFQPSDAFGSTFSKKRSTHIDKKLVKDTSIQTVDVVNDWAHNSESSHLTLINNDICNHKPGLNTKRTEVSLATVEDDHSELALVDIYLTVNLENRGGEFMNDSPIAKNDCAIPSNSTKNPSSSVILKPQSIDFSKKYEKENSNRDFKSFCGKGKKYTFPTVASSEKIPCRPLYSDVMAKSAGTLSKNKISRTSYETTARRIPFVNFASDTSIANESFYPFRSVITDKTADILAENKVSATSDDESLRQTSTDATQTMSLSHETPSILSMSSPASRLLADDPYIDRAIHLIDMSNSDDSICYIPEYEFNCENKWILNTKPIQIDLFIRRFIKTLFVDFNTILQGTEQSIIQTVTKWGEMICSRLWYRVELWIDELSLIKKHSVVYFPIDLSDSRERDSCTLLENWKRRIPLISKKAVFQEWDEADWLDGNFGKLFLFDSRYSTICKCKGTRCKTLRPVYKALLHISTYILSKVVQILKQKSGSTVSDMKPYFKTYQILTKEIEDRSLEIAETIINHENPEDILERSKIYSDGGLGLLSSLLVLRSINKSSLVFDYEHRLYALAHHLAFEVISESEESVLMEAIEDVHVRHLYKIAEKKAIEEVLNELADPIFVFTYHVLKKKTLSSLIEFLENCSSHKVVEEAIKLRTLAWKNEGFVVESDKTVSLVQALVRKSVKTKDNNLKVITNISKLRDLEHRVYDLVDSSVTCVINWIICLVDEQVTKKKALKPDFLSEVINLYLDMSCVELHKYLFETSSGFIDNSKVTSIEDVKYKRKEPLLQQLKGVTKVPLMRQKSNLKDRSEDFLKLKSKEIVRDVIIEAQFSIIEEVDPCSFELEDLKELKREIKSLMMYSKFLDMRIKKTDKEDIQKELKKYEKNHKRYVSVNLQNVTDSYYVADIVPLYQRKDLFLLEWLITGQLDKPFSPAVRRAFIFSMVLFIVCGLGYVTVKGGELTTVQCQEWLCLYFFCTFTFAFILSPMKSILFTYYFERNKTERQTEMFDYM